MRRSCPIKIKITSKMKIIFSFFLCLFFSFSIQAKQNIKYRNDTLASNFVRDNKQVGYSLFDENDFLISFHQDYLLFFYEGETYYFQAINNTEDYYRFQIKDGERNIGLLQIPESNFSSDSLTIYNLFIDFHFNFSKVKIKRELNFLPLDEEFNDYPQLGARLEPGTRNSCYD